MSDLQKLTAELMQNDEFRKEYEALQPERDITMALVNVRKEAGLTQAELSKKLESARRILADSKTAPEIQVSLF